MRRTSLLLALAAFVLTAVTGVTYWYRLEKTRQRPKPTPHVATGYESVAPKGWRYQKDDPVTNRPIVQAMAESFQATHDPSTFQLKGLCLQIFNKKAGSYTLVKAQNAFFNDGTGVMKSDDPVTVIMNVPTDVAPTDGTDLAKRVHVQTTGITYQTKTGVASTEKLVTFAFPQGSGQAVGAEYDPNTRVLHLKSAVSLDWIGKGPLEKKLHVETTDLVYKELEQKIYLTPWSKMQRETLTIQAQASTVMLDDGRLHQIDSVAAVGNDNRNGRVVQYSAANMTALFNDDGALNEIVGDKDARITSIQTTAKTTITGDRADLVFDVTTQTVNNQDVSDSQLHAVTADGHAVAVSEPIPVPGVVPTDTRILRSNHILLKMYPGGQEIQEINSPTKSNLEFKPNRPGFPHRTVEASKLRVLYGDQSYVEALTASDVTTRTDKPPMLSKSSDGKPPAPAYTWSDDMFVKFKTGQNQVESIDQKGHFRYQEGERKANAESAQVIQDINRITLKGKAHVVDDTGSTFADLIVMDQANGNMSADGHVRSTRLPDRKQKPGTSMLDATQSMQAQADKMTNSDDNTKISYTGKAAVWQGANRISADSIYIDRDDESIHAHGNVVSELVDNRDTSNSPANGQPDAKTVSDPVFTVVQAPDLVYHDDTRLALYTGGVTLTREKMIVTSDSLRAFLTPKTDDNKEQSSLDHAIGEGNVKIFETVADNRTRTGTGDHCEYFTKDDKVILTGKAPQFVDSQKGVTRGNQLTYYSSDDKLIVDGDLKKEAFTRLKRK